MGRIGALLNPSGRTGRLAYWRIQLLALILMTSFWCAGLLLAINLQIGAMSAIALAGMLPGLVIAFSALSRRLHDRNKSAWWWLVFYGVPILCNGGARTYLRLQGSNLLTPVILALLGLVLGLWGFIELSFVQGTAGPNRYGPEPRTTST